MLTINMKQLILTLSLIAIKFSLFAQFGLTAGMNLAKYSYDETRFDVHRKSILAYNFGIQYKKELTEKLFLLPKLK